MEQQTQKLAEELGVILKKRKLKCAVAESCTGGGLGACLTEIPGSSAWFEGGFITYSNQSKMQFLQVPEKILKEHGAVSKACAIAMAEGVIRNSSASVSVAITGVAGPDGGSEAKPVGTVWIAWAGDYQKSFTECFHFTGDRHSIRAQAVACSIRGLIARSNSENHPLLNTHATEKYFFALWLKKAVANKIYSELKGNVSEGHLVKPNNLHLTLAYLGKTYPNYLKDAIKIAANISTPKFELNFNNTHYWKKNKILWLGVKENASLFELQKKLISSLVSIGYIPESRDFIPHITLARNVPFDYTPELAIESLLIDKIVLAQSSGEADYKIIDEWNLEG